tara:strand:- start:621 stop:767 length:147 start_codon:yes stop_codon:yes gene_type:complete
MAVRGILEKDENHRTFMVLKETDNMTDQEYKTAVEEEFKKLEESEEKT